MKKTYALLVIVLMLGGSISALAYYIRFASPDCGQPPLGGKPITDGIAKPTQVNGQPYLWVNITFTAVSQSIGITSGIYTASFFVTRFFDPNFPHQVGLGCGTEPNAAYTIDIRVSFSDGRQETLSITYGGPITSVQPMFTVHTNPTAGVEMIQGKNFLTLLMTNPTP